ncbi:MAG TPA: DUF1501 domain-containing protein [Candidatus Eisenbacteria bacterium]|nr:DUF1501 domain-containing protein [Candidatus Eisenbacteria bacterium]
MMLTRRQILQSAAVGMTAFLLPPWARKVRAAGTDPVIVSIFQRGACDGLNTVVPVGDPFYYSSRPTVQIAPGTELPLDAFFGLNPAFADLQTVYAAGDLAFIHAAGSPDPSRSHFDAQDFMDRAAPGNKSIVDGWLNRYLGVAGGGQSIAGISISSAKTKSLVGPAPALAFESIAGFTLTGNWASERRIALEARYEIVPGLVGGTVVDAFEAMDIVAGVDTTTTVTYPTGDLGAALRDAAALIKADIGVKVIAVNIGGWDHHTNLLANLASLGAELSACLRAFHDDLGADLGRTLTLVMTEFGRRVDENGGDGTDHGHGGVMMAMGGGIAGGRVVLKDGQWPGLAPANRFIGQDLQVTTDFRDVFAEALNRHMGLAVPSMGPIFPGFSASASRFPGLYA